MLLNYILIVNRTFINIEFIIKKTSHGINIHMIAKLNHGTVCKATIKQED
jgi:hypothetical protein